MLSEGTDIEPSLRNCSAASIAAALGGRCGLDAEAKPVNRHDGIDTELGKKFRPGTGWSAQRLELGVR